jgi:hypothetical protein
MEIFVLCCEVCWRGYFLSILILLEMGRKIGLIVLLL